MAIKTNDPDAIIRSQRRRAVVASTVGTTIEWYDFFLYGTAAALVFPKLFFPDSSAYVGVLAAFGTQFVGFAARPIGAAIFGHYGDRFGRKSALITTLMLMGVGTFLIGVLPTHATIGFLAPVLLTFLRLIQGIGVGGEWGGSVLLSMEWGSARRRGFMASWPQLGVPLGLRRPLRAAQGDGQPRLHSREEDADRGQAPGAAGHQDPAPRDPHLSLRADVAAGALLPAH